MEVEDRSFCYPGHGHLNHQLVGRDMATRTRLGAVVIGADLAPVSENRNCWSDGDRFAKLTGMERPNWVYWPDQGTWRAYPEGAPDRAIHAASFEELQVQIERLSREVVKPPREIPRIERPRPSVLDIDASQYVLSQDHGTWRGHLLGAPEHAAQGESFDEVQVKLGQLCRNLIAATQLPLRKAA